ncbi:hypothetical protein ACFS6H_12160 [Terrimonas rubra]|uniref:Carboxypeptidase regulatory-like domain-containing protein n=1 Tax=Terrimonas rubra TaxID=1035890 RepID=A0ABW6A6E3_9BACT
MKTRILLATMLFSAQVSLAQENKVLLSVAAGATHHLNTGKSSPVGNGWNVQADAFVPFYQKKWNNGFPGNGFSLGGNIGGNYTGIKSVTPDNNAVADRYQVYSTTHTVSANTGGSASSAFSGQAGVQALLTWNRFSVSPVIGVGYTYLTIPAFTQTGSYTANGQTQQKDLVKRDKQNYSLLTFNPQLRISYGLGANLSLFAGGTLVAGPQIEMVTNNWVPQGGFNDKNIYEPQQMLNGSWSATNHREQYKTMQINLGLTMAIGKKRIGKGLGSGGGASSSSYAKNISAGPGEGAAQNSPVTDFNTTRSNRDNRFTDNTSNDSIPFSGPQQEIVNNRIARDSGNSMPTRLSMTPTTARQTQGNNFGEKVNQRQTPNTAFGQPVAFVSGQPISGIVVKGGKNTGGNMINATTNEAGEITFAAEETGEYTLKFAVPENEGPNEKGVEVLKSNKTGDPGAAANKREKRNYTGGRKNEAATVTIMMTPGTPIGGIVVKGGKNPGGNAINLVTDEKGTITFTIQEAGEYKLQLTAPGTSGKSISEKGVPANKPTKSK